MMELCRILYCDYENRFQFQEAIRRIGFDIDCISPEELKHTVIGEHALFIFSFEKETHQSQVLNLCEQLKTVELAVPIVLIYDGILYDKFLDHKMSPYAAETYIVRPTENVVLNALTELLQIPESEVLLDSFEEKNTYKIKIEELEKKVKELEQERQSIEKALEVQRNFYTPKLKQLLEEGKQKTKQETERLRSEIHRLQLQRRERDLKIQELEISHQKMIHKLREFYHEKIKSLSKDTRQTVTSLPFSENETSSLTNR